MLSESLQELTSLVCRVADRELPPRFGAIATTRKADGSLLTEADLVVQEALTEALTRHRPGSRVLGEEMDEAEQHEALQQQDSDVWCIDPLDGTSNFAAGVPYYAVSVALLHKGNIQTGVVYDPSRRECFAAGRGQGVWLNGQPLQQRGARVPLSGGLGLVDLKRLPTGLASRLATQPPYKSQRSFGAVALDWCWLAAGRCQAYLHGRQNLWDYAAGWLVLQEAGGRAVTLDGAPVFDATLEPRSAVAALDPELFRHWVDWLGIDCKEVRGQGA
jgi:myo-inositol-1(or 4)-monophosphatase